MYVLPYLVTKNAQKIGINKHGQTIRRLDQYGFETEAWKRYRGKKYSVGEYNLLHNELCIRGRCRKRICYGDDCNQKVKNPYMYDLYDTYYNPSNTSMRLMVNDAFGYDGTNMYKYVSNPLEIPEYFRRSTRNYKGDKLNFINMSNILSPPLIAMNHNFYVRYNIKDEGYSDLNTCLARILSIAYDNTYNKFEEIQKQIISYIQLCKDSSSGSVDDINILSDDIDLNDGKPRKKFYATLTNILKCFQKQYFQTDTKIEVFVNTVNTNDEILNDNIQDRINSYKLVSLPETDRVLRTCMIEYNSARTKEEGKYRPIFVPYEIMFLSFGQAKKFTEISRYDFLQKYNHILKFIKDNKRLFTKKKDEFIKKLEASDENANYSNFFKDTDKLFLNFLNLEKLVDAEDAIYNHKIERN